MIYPGKIGRRVNLAFARVTITAKRAVVLMLAIVGACYLPTTAYAAKGTIYFGNGASVIEASVASSAVKIPANAVPGQVVARFGGNVILTSSNVTCPITLSETVDSTPWSANPSIFLTNVPGIGAQIEMSDPGSQIVSVLPQKTAFTPKEGQTNINFFPDIYVTGPNGSGPLAIPAVNVTFSGTCIDTTTQRIVAPSGPSIQPGTCNVTNSSVSVVLPRASQAVMPNIGSIAGATDFSLGLNCSSPTGVYISLADASTPSNTSNILTPGPGSTANGVGIQISSNSVPLTFGDPAGQPGGPNWLSLGTKSGAVTIPLTAAYIRTGNLGGGVLRALATFTMSYQ
nr:F17a-G fimbrial adhesin [Paraburkholderia busanensis]